jgi:aspartyl-tRNA(Asn)/glutamyl-tRNA(Gln) amidotransferase subunit A
MCGPDPDRDSTSLDVPAEDFSRAERQRSKACASACRRVLRRRPGADVRAAVDAALAEYEKLGATLVDISLPRTELSIPVYYIIAPAEASSNLSRFDGVKFGHRAKHYTDLVDMYKKTRAEGFGDEVKRRIMIGTYVLSHGYYDAYYLQAQKIRRMIADDFQPPSRQLRRDRRPGGAHRGLEARRAWRRPAGRLPGRHLHPARLAGRPARHERAGRALARAACPWACS